MNTAKGKLLIGILTLGIVSSLFADEIARFRFLYVGAGGHFGRHGTLASNDVISVTENESAYLTDRSTWLPIDKTVPENPLVLTGGAATLGAYPTIYLLNVTTSIVTLPTAVGKFGYRYVIKTIAPATGTVATTSSQKIDGAATYGLAATNKYVQVVSDNANWWVISSN